MGIRAFIFDLDGTLQDSEVVWVDVTEAFLREHGAPVTHAEALQIVYGHAWGDVYRDVCRRLPRLNMSYADMQREMAAVFQRLVGTRDISIPGSLALLKRLARDYRVCIVSGASRADVDESVTRMGIRPLLAFFLAAEDYARGKPDPMGFLLAAERLRLPPEQCAVFEDSAAGVRAAQAAGMPCVALARPGAPAQDLSGADLVLTDLGSFSVEQLAGAARGRSRA